jgi:CRISPR-associated protein Csx3
MINSLPAILIGGPPHSGKSVLTYLLTQQLRDWQVEHYVLRACPDGEGDWSQEAPPERVRLLRQKGRFTQEFVDLICRDLKQRHLPLLVDVGGKPTADQERIFDDCTHAVLISATDEGLDEWRERAERHGLIIIAELRSVLAGDDRIDAETPVLRGQIANLERSTRAGGPMVRALAQRLRPILTYTEAEQKAHHLPHAPTELVVDIDYLADWVGLPAENRRWEPGHLPQAMIYAPVAPLSLYGRGPNWLYAAFALHVAPHPFFLFDVRLGWTAPAPIALSEQAQATHLAWKIAYHPNHTHIELSPVEPHLDYDEIGGVGLPVLTAELGVVLSGKLPHWLLVGAALAYRSHPWVAVMQAQMNDIAVVVFSRTNARLVGDTVVVNGDS